MGGDLNHLVWLQILLRAANADSTLKFDAAAGGHIENIRFFLARCGLFVFNKKGYTFRVLSLLTSDIVVSLNNWSILVIIRDGEGVITRITKLLLFYYLICSAYIAYMEINYQL